MNSVVPASRGASGRGHVASETRLQAVRAVTASPGTAGSALTPRPPMDKRARPPTSAAADRRDQT